MTPETIQELKNRFEGKFVRTIPEITPHPYVKYNATYKIKEVTPAGYLLEVQSVHDAYFPDAPEEDEFLAEFMGNKKKLKLHANNTDTNRDEEGRTFFVPHTAGYVFEVIEVAD